jgi:light-regulated signal transduction histidine kinase (bacteriophytochrome)
LGEERAVELMKSGATDFVLKDRLSRLPLCVERALKEVQEKRTRRQAEQKLMKTHAVLESKVTELERMNQELQEFAFAASHDLREPLRKIQVLGSMLREKKQHQLDEDGKDYLLRMESTAGRMQNLLDALLAYSIVAERERPYVPLDLNTVIREAMNNLEVSIQERKARIEIGRLPQVQGDPEQMVQVFQNLLSNSLKYRRGTAPLIKIHGQISNGRARVFVEDDGIGFDQQYLDRIFKPFRRLHGMDEYDGIGMGLTISRKIIERHGGKIDAKSTPGRGSTFVVELPTPSSPKE